MPKSTNKKAARGDVKNKAAKGQVKHKAARGHVSQAWPKIRKGVSTLASKSKAIYVGKTSGNSGLKERFNKKYKEKGYKSIVPVYETTSAAYANKAEKTAIKYAQKHLKSKVKNSKNAFGGPLGKDDPKIVYVAQKF